MVYHFQTKWRDEPRARGGLIRVREFVMKDAYSCDRDDAGLDASYWAQHGAYVRTFERLGSATRSRSSSDVGMMGGSLAHEFMVLNPDRRGRPGAVRGLRLCREPPGGGHPAPGAARRGRSSRWRRSRPPARRPSRPSPAFLGVGPAADREGGLLRHRRRPSHHRDRAWRPRGQRDQARQRRRGDGRHPAGHGRGDQGGRDGTGLRLTQSARRAP